MKDKSKETEDFNDETQEPTIITKLKKSLYLGNTQKGILDSLQEKLASRKLLVFLTATGLFIGAGLDPETWGMIAMFYIGGQSAVDIVQTWRHGKQ
jgi:hypothetical protein